MQGLFFEYVGRGARVKYFKTGEKLSKTLVPMELDDCDLPYVADFLRLLREAAKKVLLLMAIKTRIVFLRLPLYHNCILVFWGLYFHV